MNRILQTFLNFDPDRILQNSAGQKLKFNLYLALGIVAFSFYLDFSLKTVLLAVISYILIAKIGADIGLHRYFSHNSFVTTPLKRFYLILNSSLIGHGSILLWAATHRQHHAFSDQPADPHSPHFKRDKSISGLSLWSTESKFNPHSIKDLIKDKKIMFFHRHYFKILYAWIIFLFVISLSMGNVFPIYFFFACPCLCFFIEAELVNTVGHTVGYRNFETSDKSRNNFYLNVFTLGNGMHNNHHANQRSYTGNVLNRTSETDPMKYIIEFIFKVKHE